MFAATVTITPGMIEDSFEEEVALAATRFGVEVILVDWDSPAEDVHRVTVEAAAAELVEQFRSEWTKRLLTSC